MHYKDLILAAALILLVILTVNSIQSNIQFKEDIMINCKLNINEAEAKIRSLEMDLMMAESECNLRIINAIK